ncbi:Uncharacterized protein SCF082_LOCUS28193, partial [Durusdinium trenchii]
MGPEVRRLADAGPSLLEFWKRYKRLYPNHEVFKLVAENALKLEECVPCYMHGDEGTTYKKDGCLCLSFHCAMGRGTISNKMGPITHEVLDDPHLNFVGHAFETRFLLSAMLREDYRDDHSVMSDLLEVVVGSLDHASRNGVPLASGGKLHPVCLGNKGAALVDASQPEGVRGKLQLMAGSGVP